MSNDTKNLALYCDFENIALGVRDANYARFEINEVLERLLVKGNIVVKKAYCDWERYKGFKADMHEASFELIEIPHVRQSGKNSADIRMVVDALDLCYTKSHVDTFVIISGGIDLSVGSMFALTGVLLSMALREWGWPWPVAALAVLLFFTLWGLLLISRQELHGRFMASFDVYLFYTLQSLRTPWMDSTMVFLTQFGQQLLLAVILAGGCLWLFRQGRSRAAWHWLAAEEEDEDDPRAELIRRLQEYERFKQAAEDISELPQLGREVLPVVAETPHKSVFQEPPAVELKEVLLALKDVLHRADMFSSHHIAREALSMRARMSRVLEIIAKDRFSAFTDLFDISEGRQGVVVTFMAILELIKQQLIELVQAESYAPIHVKARS